MGSECGLCQASQNSVLSGETMNHMDQQDARDYTLLCRTASSVVREGSGPPTMSGPGKIPPKKMVCCLHPHSREITRGTTQISTHKISSFHEKETCRSER